MTDQPRSGGLIDRFVSLAAGVWDADLHKQLTTFARFYLMHMAVRDWVKLGQAPSGTRLCLALGFSACFVTSLVEPRRQYLVLWLALGLATWKLAWNLPDPSNHFAVEYVCLVLLCTLRIDRREEREPLAAALRWLPVWVFLASGLQKLFYGTYFSGVFLATMMPQERFALPFSHVLPATEMAMLSDPAYAGPYQFQSLPALVLSNAVYVFEITAAVLLLVPRTRWLGVVTGLTLVVAIEIAARELMFGMFMSALLTMHASALSTRRVFVLSTVAYPLFIAASFGLVPGGFFN